MSETVSTPGGTRRLFVALTPAPEVRGALADAAAPLLAACGAVARPVAPEAMHLTLRFLGDTAPERLPALEGALGDAAAVGPPLALAVAGAGAFPTLARAQVLWLGLEASAELHALYERVGAACAAAGFGREPRPFRAHLTVARLRRGARVDGAALSAAIAAVRPPAPFVVHTLALVASTLTHAGAEHRLVAGFPLAGQDAGEQSAGPTTPRC